MDVTNSRLGGDTPMKAALRALLRCIGHAVPNIRYLRAIPNQVLSRVHRHFALGGGVVDVLGMAMLLDPRECVDAQLWFAPHLYDIREIDYLLGQFPRAGVFLDVGANIGFWSLRFAKAFPDAVVYAFEANPETFKILQANVQTNRFSNITVVSAGISDEFGEFPLYCNDTGNRGGDSFVVGADHRTRRVMVPVSPLYATTKALAIEGVDVLKIDIEGLEDRVLRRFFDEAPHELWPSLICAEVSHSPLVAHLLENAGYMLVLKTRENCVYRFDHARR